MTSRVSNGRNTWTNYESFFPFTVYFDELICIYRRANEKWKLAHFGVFLLWRLCAADVPLSKEFNAVICSAEAFKEVSGCTG